MAIKQAWAIVAATMVLIAGSPASAFTATEMAAMRKALDRGQVIYAYDQAAWVATDELVRQVPNTNTRRQGGWIVEDLGHNTLRVVFYDGGAGDTLPLRRIFTVDVTEGRIASTHLVRAQEDAGLSELDARMINARDVALAQGKAPCAEAKFNTVVLPPESPTDPIVVYLLTPQVVTGEYPFGGHYEVDVGLDGKVTASRAFTRTCLTFEPNQAQQTTAFVVTHLQDPIPTEIHVFLSLWTKKPVFVLTNHPRRIWEVNGRHMSLVPK
jgi:hypothetical protein